MKIKNNRIVTLIVGFPGSGKTYSIEKFISNQSNVNCYDDFMHGAKEDSLFPDNPSPEYIKRRKKLLDDLSNKQQIIITDTRFCIFDVFKKIIEIIIEKVDADIMTIVLFEADHTTALHNIKIRNKYDKSKRDSRISSEIKDLEKYNKLYCHKTWEKYIQHNLPKTKITIKKIFSIKNNQ